MVRYKVQPRFPRLIKTKECAFGKSNIFVDLINADGPLSIPSTLRDLIRKADCLKLVGRGVKPKTEIQEPVLLDQLWLRHDQVTAMI